MPPVLKETLKFSLFALFCLGVILAAAFVVPPYALSMDETRRAAVVQYLVPGTALAAAVQVKDGTDSVLLYRPQKGVAVVFMKAHLFMKDMDLAFLVENDKIARMYDLNLGLPPFNPGLRNLFLTGTTVPSNGADTVGGATIDFSRLAMVLDRVVSIVRKAGSK